MEVVLLLAGPQRNNPIYFIATGVFMMVSAIYSTHLGRKLQRQLGNSVVNISSSSPKLTAKIGGVKDIDNFDNNNNSNKDNGMDVANTPVPNLHHGSGGDEDGDGESNPLASPTILQTPGRGDITRHGAVAARLLLMSPSALEPMRTRTLAANSDGGGNDAPNHLQLDGNGIGESKLPSQSPMEGVMSSLGTLPLALVDPLSPHRMIDNDTDMTIISPARAGGLTTHHSTATLQTLGSSGGRQLSGHLVAVTTRNANGTSNTSGITSGRTARDLVSSGEQSVATIHATEHMNNNNNDNDGHDHKHDLTLSPVNKHSTRLLPSDIGGVEGTTLRSKSLPTTNGGIVAASPIGQLDETCLVLSNVNASLAKAAEDATIAEAERINKPPLANGTDDGNGNGVIPAASVTIVQLSNEMEAEKLYGNMQRMDAQHQIRSRVWLFTSGSAICALIDVFILCGGMAFMYNARTYERSLVVLTIWRTNQMIWVTLLLRTFWPRGTQKTQSDKQRPSGQPSGDAVPLLGRAVAAAGRLRAAVRAAIPSSSSPRGVSAFHLMYQQQQRQRQDRYAAELALGVGGSHGYTYHNDQQLHHQYEQRQGRMAGNRQWGHGLMAAPVAHHRYYHNPNHNHDVDGGVQVNASADRVAAWMESHGVGSDGQQGRDAASTPSLPPAAGGMTNGNGRQEYQYTFPSYQQRDLSFSSGPLAPRGVHHHEQYHQPLMIDRRHDDAQILTPFSQPVAVVPNGSNFINAPLLPGMLDVNNNDNNNSNNNDSPTNNDNMNDNDTPIPFTRPAPLALTSGDEQHFTEDGNGHNSLVIVDDSRSTPHNGGIDRMVFSASSNSSGVSPSSSPIAGRRYMLTPPSVVVTGNGNSGGTTPSVSPLPAATTTATVISNGVASTGKALLVPLVSSYRTALSIGTPSSVPMPSRRLNIRSASHQQPITSNHINDNNNNGNGNGLVRGNNHNGIVPLPLSIHGNAAGATLTYTMSSSAS
jgi:hypothetical protein